ncbi:MAG: MFS transporter [Chlamydiales bacterium]|nr:MFS transporter [Chlamydiales bacterium]
MDFTVFIAPIASLFLLMLSSGYYLTFMSLKVKMLGYSDYAVGLMGSSLYMGLFIGAVIIEPFIRRIGHIRAFSCFAALCSGTILLQAFFSNLDASKGLADYHLWFWCLMRVGAGFCVAGLYVVIESWLLAKSSPSNRGVVLSVYMGFLYGAHAFSQFFVKWLDQTSMTPFLVAVFFCSMSTIPVLVTYSTTPELHKPSVKGIPHVIQASPLGFWGCVVSGVMLASLFSFTPIFAEEYDLKVSIVMSSLIMGGCLLQLPIGKLSDWGDRRAVIVALGLLVMLPSSAIVYFCCSDPLAVYFLCFLIGGLTFAVYPVSISHVCDRVDQEDIVSVTGLLLLAYSIGSVVGPILTSVYIEKVSGTSSGLFIFTSIIAFILAIYGAIATMKREAVPGDEKGEFVALPRQSPVVSELNPRAEEEEV